MTDGILVLYKDKGMTSHDAVNIVRKLFHTKQVGHTGTLDPQATGILPILVGRAVKFSEYLVCDKKKYRAKITFGMFCDTEDIWGKVLEKGTKRTDEESFIKALGEFVGEYMQTPPMTSAIKVGGKKLYELQRMGIEVERTPRKCEIYSAEMLGFSEDEAEIVIECSKGTYVRTFIYDLMKKLGITGVMSELERLENAGFGVSDSVTLDTLKNTGKKEIEKFLLPTENYFFDKKVLKPHDFYLKLIKNGCAVNQKKLGCNFDENEIIRLYDDDGFFALGTAVISDGEIAIKKIKELRR